MFYSILVIFITGNILWSCGYLFIKKDKIKSVEMIFSIPPFLLVFIMADAFRSLKGSGGNQYSLSIKQITIQIIGMTMYAIAILLYNINYLKQSYYCVSDKIFYIMVFIDFIGLLILTSTLYHVATIQLNYQQNDLTNDPQMI